MKTGSLLRGRSSSRLSPPIGRSCRLCLAAVGHCANCLLISRLHNARELAQSIWMGVAGLDVLDASYMIGVLYTGMMPGRFRAELGV